MCGFHVVSLHSSKLRQTPGAGYSGRFPVNGFGMNFTSIAYMWFFASRFEDSATFMPSRATPFSPPWDDAWNFL